MKNDPRQIIADSPMSVLQLVVIGLTIALNALAGIDVMAISFASPGIAAEARPLASLATPGLPTRQKPRARVGARP